MSRDPQREALLQIVEGTSSLKGIYDHVQRIGTDGGSGCFSLVFAAADVRTGEPVALKFYHPLLRSAEPMHVYRWDSFQREASLLLELAGQRDIITCLSPLEQFTHTVSDSRGLTFPIQFAYYTLELAYTDVLAMIESSRWNPVSKLIAFAAMCRAVQRLHNHRICHRDLKPSNFLVLRDGAVKLADLGTACKLDGNTPHLHSRYSFYPGDAAYSSPEMLACLHDEDAEIGYKCDYFSLGAILFELFTGAILGDRVFDTRYYSDLEQFAHNVKSGEKHNTFHAVLDSIKAGYQLPDLETFDPSLPRGVRGHLNALYKSLADLDYRARLTDFRRLFGQIQICLLILRNEETYRRFLEERRRRRAKRRNT